MRVSLWYNCTVVLQLTQRAHITWPALTFAVFVNSSHTVLYRNFRGFNRWKAKHWYRGRFLNDEFLILSPYHLSLLCSPTYAHTSVTKENKPTTTEDKNTIWVMPQQFLIILDSLCMAVPNSWRLKKKNQLNPPQKNQNPKRI